MFTKRKSLIGSIVLFVISILYFIFSPNVVGPGLLWLLTTGVLVLLSILLLCNYLRLKFGFSTAKLIGIFVVITIVVCFIFLTLFGVLYTISMNAWENA